MLQLYKYIFCKIYYLFRNEIKYDQKLEEPNLITTIRVILLMILFLNSPIFFGLYRLFLICNLFPTLIMIEKENALSLLLELLIMIIFNYFIFIYNKRYLKIVNEFKKETKQQSIIGWIFISFMIIICGLFFIYTHIFLKIPV